MDYSSLIISLIATIIFTSLNNIQFTNCAPQDYSILEQGPGYNTYGHQQMKAAKVRGIKPIVDTIREDEKYGNDGGHIRAISNTFIQVSESASGSISKALGTPNENTFNLLQGLYPILQDIGNRLGGLA